MNIPYCVLRFTRGSQFWKIIHLRSILHAKGLMSNNKRLHERRRNQLGSFGYSNDRKIFVEEAVEYIVDIKASPKGSAVYHTKSSTYTGSLFTRDAGWQGIISYDISNAVLFPAHTYDGFFDKEKQSFYRSFDHSKLPTSSEFNSLAFIAELDETMLLFTKKFWKELSYGSFTWGVMPFVNEVEKLLKTIDKFNKANGNQPKLRDGRSRTGKFKSSLNLGANFDTEVEYVFDLKKVGQVSYGDASEASVWLDKLGVYADLNTAWDLVPLSFLVDWFIPVGDFLSSMHPSGNIRSVAFSGFNSFKAHHSTRFTGIHAYDKLYVSNLDMQAVQKHDQYHRFYSSELLHIGSKKQPTFELPSIRNIFDTFYVFALSGKKRN